MVWTQVNDCLSFLICNMGPFLASQNSSFWNTAMMPTPQWHSLVDVSLNFAQILGFPCLGLNPGLHCLRICGLVPSISLDLLTEGIGHACVQAQRGSLVQTGMQSPRPRIKSCPDHPLPVWF